MGEVKEVRTQTDRYSLGGEGPCVGRDGGDAVMQDYGSDNRFTGGDIADDAFVDVERVMAAAMARD